MAATKITSLTSISTIDTAVDPLPIVDVSDTSQSASGTTKKVTVDQIESSIFGATGSKAIVVDNVAALKALTVASVDDGQVFLTRGYYSDNDGGQGTYVYDAASSASDNGGTVIAPTSGTGRYLLQYSGDLNVLQFGAYPNNTNAATTTAAIQTAVTLATANAKKVFIPKGTYRLNDSIKIAAFTQNWTISGETNGTVLLQSVVAGNSAAIFEFIGAEISNFLISDLMFQWDDINSVSGYKGCGILFSAGPGNYNYGVYNFTIERVYSVYGFRFISNYDLSASTSSGINIWGATINRCNNSYMRGGSIRLTNGGSGGSPNFNVESFYVIGKTDGQPVASSPYTYSETIFFFDGGIAGLKFSDVEINNVSTNGYIFDLVGGPGSSVVFENCRVENVRIRTNFLGIIDLINIGATINGFDISAIYVDAGLTSQVVKFISSDGVGHKLVLLNLDNQNNAGYPTFILGAGATARMIEATPGSLALVGNMPSATGASRYGQGVPNINAVRQFNFTSFAYGNTYTPYSSYTNDAPNVFRVWSPGPTLTINAVVGANAGSEYIFIIRDDGGTLTSIAWNAAYIHDGNSVPVGNNKVKTVRFVYDGINFIQVGAPSGNI